MQTLKGPLETQLQKRI